MDRELTQSAKSTDIIRPSPRGQQSPGAPCSSGSATPNTSHGRVLSRNANGTVAMTTQPTNESELQLYRVLQRANLLAYYDTFICQGGDDVQQLCEAGEEEFLEIMALVGMASKPLHVRRLQKALQEWVSNPAMFQTPLVPPALPPSHAAANHHMGGASGMGRGGAASAMGQMPPSMRPSPPMAPTMMANHSSPSPHGGGAGASQASKDVVPSSPSAHQLQQQQHQMHHHQQHMQQQHQQQQQHHQQQQQQQQQQQTAQQQQQAAAAAAAAAHSQLQQMYSQALPPYVMNMPEDDPRRMDEIRKYAAIYGRFDCKRKPEKPLTMHEVSVNEAAAQICKHIPALLTRRDELFPLARQVVRDSGYPYSKGHSRSQMYNKMDEETCKRLRLDASPGQANDKSQMEEERKKRQERLDAISEQLKLLGSQQEEMKTRLQQAREMQNFGAVSHLQSQLEQISTQQMQLINDQSELNKQIRRIERCYMGGKGCGRLSSCSDPDKMDNDDTDSQFSAYSNASSPTLSHEAHDSPSQDSNQSNNNSAAADVFGTMKMVKKTSAQITKQLVQETLMDEGLRVVKELANQIKEESEVAAATSAMQPNNGASPPRNNSNSLNSHSHQPQQTGSNSSNSGIMTPSKPDGPRPRGRPPRLDRDYGANISTSTAVGSGSSSSRAATPMGHPPPASTPSPSSTNHNGGGNNMSSSVAPILSPSAQNGRSPGPMMNGPCSSGDPLNGPNNMPTTSALSSNTNNNGGTNMAVSASLSSSSEGFAMPMTNGTASLNNHHPHHHHQVQHHPHHGSHSPVIDISSPGGAGSGGGIDMNMGSKGSSNSLNALLAFSQKGIKQEPSSPNNAYKID